MIACVATNTSSGANATTYRRYKRRKEQVLKRRITANILAMLQGQNFLNTIKKIT